MGEPIFFESPSDWRKWLEEHHDKETEVFLGLHKVKSKPGAMTWSQAVDEALCFGWIDGIRRGVDEHRTSLRFTPRKARSTWSAVNIDKAERLTAEGRMTPAGARAYEARTEDRSRIYSFEQKDLKLPAEAEKRLRAHEKAWEFWVSRPPSYRKVVMWWLISAKREETRERRLVTLIEDCAAGRLIKSQRRTS